MIRWTILIGLTILSGCAIESFEGSGEPNGSIFVASGDGSGNEISAAILIDGVVRPERTPAYVHGISVGDHEIVVKLYGFWNDTLLTTVTGGDTVNAEFVLEEVPPGQTGQLDFATIPSGGKLIVDGQFHTVDGTPVIAPAMVDLPWGSYRISSYLEDHANLRNALPEVTIIAGEATEIGFAHEGRQTALQAGLLPFHFRLENDVGDSVSLAEQTGQVVLLNFWYVSCVPCQREFPGIDSVYQRHAIDGFQVLAIDAGDSPDRVRTFRSNFNLTFQLLLDPEREVNSTYGITSYPQNILIDRTGSIHEILGPVTQDELEELVLELL